jgi:UDP-2,3-diacylglucosamine hydrolase
MTHYVDDYRLDRWVLPDWDFDCEKPRGGYLTFAGGYLHFEEV